MTLLTESEAWREVAERIDSGSNGFYTVRTTIHLNGLIDLKTHAAMLERGALFWENYAPVIDATRDERVLAALFLSLEAEDDAKP